ncbi:MAG: HAD-IIA family hydrolase [Corynebacterium sp.]|nr:HAD-IIA family hydrolase [Corynebacterium sp.]
MSSSPLSAPLGQLPAQPAGITRVADVYDLLILDLDGTVRKGHQLLPGAADTLGQVSTARAFVTNNAMHSPAEVAQMLTSGGLTVEADAVFTSPQAALAELTVTAETRVYVLGTPALAEIVERSGCQVVHAGTPTTEPVDIVLQGLDMNVDWARLSEAAAHVRAGARYVSTNMDSTIPTETGLGLGNGAMTAAISAATGVIPDSYGKPHPALYHLAAQQCQARTPLAVGDRLDTDIAAGSAAGMDTMVVLTGVTTPLALLSAPPGQRPRLIAEDIRGVLAPLEEVKVGLQGGFVSTIKGKDLIISGGSADSTPLQALRSVCTAAWTTTVAPTNVLPASDYAEKAVNAWW